MTIPSTTDDLIAEIEAAAKAATPGPWWIDSHGHTMVSHADDNVQTVFVADSRMGKSTRHPQTGNLSHWPNDWDASYIALANPANVLALIAEIRDFKRWKAEQLQVMGPVMDYAHGLKIAPLGGSVTQALIDDHKRLSELEEAQTKTLKDLKWRIEDISAQLTERRGGDGESLYGLDEFSSPIMNLATAVRVIDAKLEPQS